MPVHPYTARDRPLWRPSDSRSNGSCLARFLDRHGFGSYGEAWAWSVDPSTSARFWSAVAEELGLEWRRPPRGGLELGDGPVQGARWFDGGILNYAEQALRDRGGGESPALLARSQSRPPATVGRGDLRELVGRLRQGLTVAGVHPGERVAGYLPNIPETVAAMLATASLGAVWTCCAPEMGTEGVLDRFGQVEPAVLLAVDGYRYGDRTVERTDEAEVVRAALPTVRAAISLPYLQPGRAAPPGWTDWAELVARGGNLEFAPVGFDHPLYILFSSGTTGKPKPIVHCHGGIALEHAKAIGLHFDVGPLDRFFWFTSTGWMMWNFLVSGLLVGATVVLFDGNPLWPTPDALWELMAETATTCGGVGSAYLAGCAKSALRPSAEYDLSALVTLGATGSPLAPAAAEWAYREVGRDLMLGSFSGGTDVCTGFVGPSPLHPVWAGEISCRCLGAAVEVFDDSGRAVTGREGELVLTAPLPSMPVGLWGDADGSRYRSSYFDRFPGVWTHGDRATLTDRGTVVITGRSDGTLNRGGVRMGTAEIYSVVEALDGVADSLAVHLEDPSGGAGELLLFVVEAGPGEGLESRIREALRRQVSPRHVPDAIVKVGSIPRTLSGKKLEVPVKRILCGVAPQDALSVASVADPSSLDPFVELARTRASPARGRVSATTDPAS